ncbi:MAG TPA: RsmB/NOP family class I SAM-dependent RNA methyltransferase [Streptosporangiaceae bacterium]|nr:RsmB/NOP family class I SAM-dependent RNA methyltransferase [Streptosporangiaceae bacterium]
MTDPRKRATFTGRVAEVYGVRPAEVPRLLAGPRSSTVRLNRLAAAAEEILADLVAVMPEVEPVSWCADTYFCLADTGCAAAIALAEQGLVYIQNASSLIPVVLLDPQPGELILDTAAAPGGKAFHIAARTDGAARLWLNDAIAPRADKLRDLARLYRVPYEKLTSIPAQYLDKELPAETFDRILLDVQCSGEGRIDLRRSDALRYWSQERIDRYKYQQTRMLEAAYRLLRPGGTMVYSTCTIAPEENEFPVSQVLRRHDDLEVQPALLDQPNFRPGLGAWRGYRFGPALRHALRVLPTDHFEAFFAAKLVKAA